MPSDLEADQWDGVEYLGVWLMRLLEEQLINFSNMGGTGSTAAADNIGSSPIPLPGVFSVAVRFKIRSEIKDAIGLPVSFKSPILRNGLKCIGVAAGKIGPA